MTACKRTAVERRLIEGFVRRAAETEAPLLAADLRRHATREGLSWEELARSLGGSSDGLDQVALCRKPRAERFPEDVAAIAAGHVDVDRFLLLLRRIQVLASFRGFPAAAPARRDSEVHGMLLAARDQEEAEASGSGNGADTDAGEAEDPTGEREPSHE